MIINLRGTSGSGKSTIARWLIAQCIRCEPINIEGRKQPLYYACHIRPHESIAVLGHYETACGGCDTLPSYDVTLGLVRDCACEHEHVFYEGLLISSDVKRTLALHREFGDQLLVLSVNHPLEDCLASVNKRRWAKDPTKPGVNPGNTTSKWKAVHSAHEKLLAAGVPAELLSRQDCRQRIAELLLGDPNFSIL